MLKADNEKLKRQAKEMASKESLKLQGSNPLWQIDEDDYYRRKLMINKLEGTDPVWKQLEVLARPEISSLDLPALRTLAEKLWLGKLELLAHLEKAQVELKTLKEGTDARTGYYMREKEELAEELRLTRMQLDGCRDAERGASHPRSVCEQSGVKYDDSTSVFEMGEEEMKGLGPNENYFDIYLGTLRIEEAELIRHPENKLRSMAQFISFLTVDFYNHETQHSSFL
jgi:hypothetical protein